MDFFSDFFRVVFLKFTFQTCNEEDQQEEEGYHKEVEAKDQWPIQEES